MSNHSKLFFAAATLFAAAHGTGDYECKPKIDLMLLQDASHNGDVFNKKPEGYRLMRPWLNGAEEVLQNFTKQAPDTRLGMGMFVDKPYYWSDYCFRLGAPMGSTPEEIVAAFRTQIASDGGYDWDMGQWWPENQLGAMMRAAKYDGVNWGTEDADRTKVMWVVTDSIPNPKGWYEQAILTNWGSMQKFEGDNKNKYTKPNPLSHDNFTWSTVNIDQKDNSTWIEDQFCNDFEYPSWPEWAKVMKKNNILPVFLVTEPQYWDKETNEWVIAPELKQQAVREKLSEDAWTGPNGLVAYYNYWLKKTGVFGYVERSSENFDYVNNFVPKSKVLLDKVLNHVCNGEISRPTLFPTKPVITTTEGPHTLHPIMPTKPVITTPEAPHTLHPILPTLRPSSTTTQASTSRPDGGCDCDCDFCCDDDCDDATAPTSSTTTSTTQTTTTVPTTIPTTTTLPTPIPTTTMPTTTIKPTIRPITKPIKECPDEDFCRKE